MEGRGGEGRGGEGRVGEGRGREGGRGGGEGRELGRRNILDAHICLKLNYKPCQYTKSG